MSQTELNIEYRQVSMNEIQKNIRLIVNLYHPDKVILFGSYANGNIGPDSDVDLLIVMDTEQPTWDLAVKISSALKHTFPMDIIVRTPKEIARKLELGDFFIKNIMEKGTVLYERGG